MCGLLEFGSTRIARKLQMVIVVLELHALGELLLLLLATWPIIVVIMSQGCLISRLLVPIFRNGGVLVR